MREHDELLFAAERHDAILGQHLNAIHRRIVRAAVGHALSHPAHEHAVVIGIGIDALAAAVRENGRAFEEEQTAIGRSGEEPASARFLHEMLVIFRRFKAEQRKAESVLARRLAVAPAAVATSLGEDGCDLVRKIDRQHLLELLDVDRDGRVQAVGRSRDDRRRTIADWSDQTSLVHFHDTGRRRFVSRRARHVTQRTIRLVHRDEQLLASVRPAQFQCLGRCRFGSGVDGQRCRRWLRRGVCLLRRECGKR
jgi:hypothetical protein